jgi:hypothetical protein
MPTIADVESARVRLKDVVRETPLYQTEIELVVSTRGERRCQELLATLRDAGLTVECTSGRPRSDAVGAS